MVAMNGIIIFSTLFFLLFGVMGWLYPNNKLWNYIDTIYYPLGAVGVLFLFLMQGNERELFDLYEQSIQVDSKLNKVVNSNPNIPNTFINEEYIRFIGQQIDFIRRWENICKAGGGESHRCIVANKLGPIASKYTDLFSVSFNTPAEKNKILMSICNGGMKILDEIENEGAVSEFILETLKRHYISAVQNGYWFPSYEKRRKHIDLFKSDSLKQYEKILPHLSDYKLMKKVYESEVEFLSSV